MWWHKEKTKAEQKEPEYIGEVLIGRGEYSSGYYRLTATDPSTRYTTFQKFTREDRGYPDHDGFVHIFSLCHKKENVIFYADIAPEKAFKQAIAKRWSLENPTKYASSY